METDMKKSSFQFKDPKLIHFTFSINDEFNSEIFNDMSLKSTVKIDKEKNENTASVDLQLKIGDETAPFIVDITMGSDFKWDISIEEAKVYNLLSFNAPALLLGYMRPIVSLITAKSKYPEFNIPFIDFRPIDNCDNKNNDDNDD